MDGQIVVTCSQGRRVDIYEFHVDELQAADEGPVAEGARLNLVDGRVANDDARYRHGAEGILAYDLSQDVVHSNLRDVGGKHPRGQLRDPHVLEHYLRQRASFEIVIKFPTLCLASLTVESPVRSDCIKLDYLTEIQPSDNTPWRRIDTENGLGYSQCYSTRSVATHSV